MVVMDMKVIIAICRYLFGEVLVKFVTEILRETQCYLLILWYSMLVLHLISIKLATTNK